MAKVHRRIGTPIATELALRATGFEIDRGTLAPSKLPDVYAGAPVVVFGRYRGRMPVDGAITVLGTSLGDPLRMTVPGTLSAEAAGWLAASWARAHLRDLEDRYAAGAHELEPQIVRVSKQFGVLSRFTAFVAIDHSVVNPGGEPRAIVQPVELPEGDSRKQVVGQVHMASMTRAGGYAGAYSGAPRGKTYAIAGLGAPSPSARAPIVRLRAGDPRSPEPEAAFREDGVRRKHMPGIDDGDPVAASPPSRTPPPPFPPSASALSERSPAVYTVYLTRLAALAVELAAEARGRCEPSAIRLVRQRLVQWFEDLRSVGGHGDVASVVEALVLRLSAAIAAPASLAVEATAVADALARLAAGEPPPAAPPVSRPAFWK